MKVFLKLAWLASAYSLAACSEATTRANVPADTTHQPDTLVTITALDSVAILGADINKYNAVIHLVHGGQVPLRMVGFRGTDTIPLPDVRWAVDDAAILSVSSTGALKGVLDGTTLVRAQTGAYVAARRAEVWELADLKLYNPGPPGLPYHILLGDSVRSAWSANSAGGPSFPFGVGVFGTPVTFASSNPRVVLVDSTGMVRAVGLGTAVIRMTTPLTVPGKLIDTLTYVVQAPTPMSISLDPHPDTVYTLVPGPFSGQAQGTTRYNGPIQSVTAQFVSETGRVVTKKATLVRSDSVTERWSVSAASDTLSPGRYSVLFTAADEFGRTSAAKDSFTVVIPTVTYDVVTLVEPTNSLNPWVYAASGTLAVGVTSTFESYSRPVVWRAGVQELLPTADTGTYRPSGVNHDGTIIGTRSWHPDRASTTTCSQPVAWTSAGVRLIPTASGCPANYRGVDINDRGQFLIDGPPSIVDGASTTSVPLNGGVFFLDESGRVLGRTDASGKTPPVWAVPSGTLIPLAGTGDASTVYLPLAVDEAGCVLEREHSDDGAQPDRYSVSCLDGRRFMPLDAVGGGGAIDMQPNGTVLTSNGFLVTRANRVLRIQVAGYPWAGLIGRVLKMSDTGVVYLQTFRGNGGQGSGYEIYVGLSMLVPR